MAKILQFVPRDTPKPEPEPVDESSIEETVIQIMLKTLNLTEAQKEDFRKELDALDD